MRTNEKILMWFGKIVAGFIVLTIAVYIILVMFASLETETAEVDAYRTDFVAGCNEDGVSYDFCNCAFDYIVENYGLRGMDFLSQEVADGYYPPEIDDATLACQNLLLEGERI